MMKTMIAVLAFSTSAMVFGAENTALKNWFGDPFFQISAGMPACPVPLGPLLTETEMKAEAHSRVERGTSCWISGQCSQPNAYLYDAGIAQTIRERVKDNPTFNGDSLWITVKRRFVWAEGCVTDPSKASVIEAMLRAVPEVQSVFVNVMQGKGEHVPYKILDDANAK